MRGASRSPQGYCFCLHSWHQSPTVFPPVRHQRRSPHRHFYIILKGDLGSKVFCPRSPWSRNIFQLFQRWSIGDIPIGTTGLSPLPFSHFWNS